MKQKETLSLQMLQAKFNLYKLEVFSGVVLHVSLVKIKLAGLIYKGDIY
jgi:hypothetical protein